MRLMLEMMLFTNKRCVTWMHLLTKYGSLKAVAVAFQAKAVAVWAVAVVVCIAIATDADAAWIVTQTATVSNCTPNYNWSRVCAL